MHDGWHHEGKCFPAAGGRDADHVVAAQDYGPGLALDRRRFLKSGQQLVNEVLGETAGLKLLHRVEMMVDI